VQVPAALQASSVQVLASVHKVPLEQHRPEHAPLSHSALDEQI
jgi:hypothetical protein